MKHMHRAAVTVLTAGLLASGSFPSLRAAEPPAEETAAPSETEASRQERQRLAKERRIAEYLRKKEEKRARRSQDSVGREAPVVEPEQEAAPPTPTAAAEVSTAPARTKAPKPRKGERLPPLPRALARTQDTVRHSSLAQDPTVASYLELVDRQEASPQQLAAFGNFLGQNGLPHEALAYYDVALRLEDRNPVLWLNAGTLHRQVGDNGAARSAYSRALSLDPNNAQAHYNLGAVFDETGQYQDALEAYKVALGLDPTLGDPATNPQAANNERLVAVKLMLYRERAGSLGLPLVEIPGGGVDTGDAPPAE